jgi:hypothetical protein
MNRDTAGQIQGYNSLLYEFSMCQSGTKRYISKNPFVTKSMKYFIGNTLFSHTKAEIKSDIFERFTLCHSPFERRLAHAQCMGSRTLQPTYSQ